jgi:hypothetical protein
MMTLVQLMSVVTQQGLLRMLKLFNKDFEALWTTLWCSVLCSFSEMDDMSLRRLSVCT